MRIGVDTSVIVAAVHANHPLHGPSARWLNDAFDAHEVVVAHHSVLEAYAVLTRLPGEYRLAPSEAEMVLHATVRDNAELAPFSEALIWDLLRQIGETPASGGAVYDAFIIGILMAAGVDAIATGNTAEFRRFSGSIRIIDPLE